MTPAAPRARQAGFTLIELLAVLAMFALIAGLILPRFSIGGEREVRREAEALGEAVELARQRAIMTARPHQVVLDLERGLHWVEWAPPPPPETEAVAARADERAAGSRKVDMTPPPAASGELAFEPVPGAFGRAHVLGENVVFVAAAFPDTTFDSGLVTIAFDPDGAADPVVVSLADPGGAYRFEVEVQALADAVLVVDATPERAHGFTLLEVMAAFALLAIAYTTLGGAGAQSLQKEGEAARRLDASLLADRVLGELEAGFEQGAAPPPGEEERVEGIYTVAIRVAPWEPVIPERETPLAVERGERRARRPGESIRNDEGASLGPSLLHGERGQPGPLRRVDVVVGWDEGWSQARVVRTTFGLDPQAAAASLEALGAAAAGAEAGQGGPPGTDASGLGGRIERGGTDRRQR